MGVIGKWGEWHSSVLSDSTKLVSGEWFRAAFSETMLQARYPQASLDNTNVGLHDDSFAWSTLGGAANGGVTKSWYFWPKVISNGFNDPPFWKIGVMGGETRPELQETIFSPSYPVRSLNHQDFDLCVETTTQPT